MQTKPLISAPEKCFGANDFFDCLEQNASLIENKLMAQGGKPGKDYTLRDLFNWSMAITVEKFKTKKHDGVH